MVRENYGQLADTKLPRARQLVKQSSDKLYVIEKVDPKDEVKIHYIGYTI